MPLVRFWLFQNNINRVSAEREIRSLSLNTAANSGNPQGIKEYRQSLILELGHVTRVEERLDKVGMQRLAALA